MSLFNNLWDEIGNVPKKDINNENKPKNVSRFFNFNDDEKS